MCVTSSRSMVMRADAEGLRGGDSVAPWASSSSRTCTNQSIDREHGASPSNGTRGQKDTSHAFATAVGGSLSLEMMWKTTPWKRAGRSSAVCCCCDGSAVCPSVIFSFIVVVVEGSLGLACK